MSVNTDQPATQTSAAQGIKAEHEFKAGTIAINGVTYDVMATFIRDGNSIKVSPETISAKQAQIDNFARNLLQSTVDKLTEEKAPDLVGKTIVQLNSTKTKVTETDTPENASTIDHTPEVKNRWDAYQTAMIHEVFSSIIVPTGVQVRLEPRIDIQPDETVQGTKNQFHTDFTNHSFCTTAATVFANRILERGPDPQIVVEGGIDHALTAAHDQHRSIQGSNERSLTQDEVDSLFSNTLVRLKGLDILAFTDTPLEANETDRSGQFRMILENYAQFDTSIAGTITVNGLSYGIATIKKAGNSHDFYVFDSHGLNTTTLGARGPAFIAKFDTAEKAGAFIATKMILPISNLDNNATINAVQLTTYERLVADERALEVKRAALSEANRNHVDYFLWDYAGKPNDSPDEENQRVWGQAFREGTEPNAPNGMARAELLRKALTKVLNDPIEVEL